MAGSSRFEINPTVLVGVPTLEKHPLSWQWADYFYNLNFPLAVSHVKYRCAGLPVDEARNNIVQRALDIGADYVLFVGDDNLLPTNTFDLLRRHREYMVTGVYWTKGHPKHPYLWNGLQQGPYMDWKYGEYFPVDWAGCDCLLVHTDVFKAIDPPWFSTKWAFERDKPTYLPTEDLYFYTKARQRGFRLFCDSEVQCDHQDRGTGVRFGLTSEMTHYFRDGEPVEGDESPILVADIGSGADTPWFGIQSKVVRFDVDRTFRPDVRCDVRHIPEKDNKFDVVHARHVLEHFAPFEASALVREWARVLKPGGRLVINVPNLGYAARQILRAEEGEEVGVYPLWQLFGMQMGVPNEVHKNGFTKRSLESLLQTVGLENIDVKVQGDSGENVHGVGFKTAEPVDIAPAMKDEWLKLEGQEEFVHVNGS